MAPISMIRSSTVHDLVTRTSSGGLSNSIIIMENLCWKFQEQEDPEAYKYHKCVDRKPQINLALRFLATTVLPWVRLQV